MYVFGAANLSKLKLVEDQPFRREASILVKDCAGATYTGDTLTTLWRVGGMDRHRKYDGTSQGSINATPDGSNTARVNNIELDPTECVEKVEAMVSTAILHQEDVWNLIMSLFPDVDMPYNNDPKSGLHENHLVRISTPLPVLNAIKEKLESSMDWCRLAQCRLKGILPESSNN